MTTAVLTRWLRAMNPFIRPRAMAEAQRSARAGVIGLGISLLAGIPSTVWMLTGDRFEALMADQYAAMQLSSADIAIQQAMMQTIFPYMLIASAVFTVALYGVLAFVQWRHMTRAIPIVLLGLMIYGVVANIGMRLLGSFPGTDLPLWIQLISWTAMAVTSIIYIAALQGAIMLHALKGQR